MGGKAKRPEWLTRHKNATAPGTYPGQNRSRRFRDRKKHSDKYKARQKVKDW